MKKALLFLLVWLLPVGLFAQQRDNNQQKTLVFTHVTVIDATGAPAKPDMTVVIKGGRIAALGKTANLDVPENAHVVDATGKFLIPGLWDMHIHPKWGKNYLALFIANGVTSVRVMGGSPRHHEWREEISAGQLIGPRMVIASPIVDGPNARNYIAVISEDEGRQVVRKVKKEGADFVKVYDNLPRDAYFAIADEAKKQGIPLAGHVPYSVSAVEASDAGQQSVEHCRIVLPACSSREEELRKKFMEASRASIKLLADTYSEQKAAALFARFVKNSTWVCPTLTVWSAVSFRDEEEFANDPRLKYIPRSIRDMWKNQVRGAFATGEARANLKKVFEKNLAIVGAMGRAGVGLLAGTDTPVPCCFPGFILHDELALFVRAGLSPMEALRTATYNPAKFFGKLDSMGAVERGKVADLVLLDANPLQDISNTQKIAAVVFGGKIFQRAALQKMLAQVKAARLHKAAADGDIEDVKSLISEGADVNARDQQGWTPALASLYGRALAVTDLLLEKGADTAAPHMAAYVGDLRGIKRLLEKDAPVDSLKGLTLLHAAAAGGHTDVVEFLIAKGFEVTATTEDDATPVHYAAAGNHQEAAEILMANGAPVDSGKATPLFAAAYAGHKDMIKLLISKGADVNAVDNTRVTALHIAGKYGHVNVAALLIDKGAGVNAKDKWLWTPLHYACRENRKETVEFLLAKGAGVNTKDKWLWTPLHYACRENHKETVEFLLAKGANLNAKEEKGKTPLAVAKKEGHTEIVELLRKHGAKE